MKLGDLWLFKKGIFTDSLFVTFLLHCSFKSLQQNPSSWSLYRLYVASPTILQRWFEWECPFNSFSISMDHTFPIMQGSVYDWTLSVEETLSHLAKFFIMSSLTFTCNLEYWWAALSIACNISRFESCVVENQLFQSTGARHYPKDLLTHICRLKTHTRTCTQQTS